MFGAHYGGEVPFPYGGAPGFGAPNVVVVPLHGTGGRHAVVYGVNGTEGSSQHRGLGFSEAFPNQLSQMWSSGDWTQFIDTANRIVSDGIGCMYRWRCLLMFGPLILVLLIVIPLNIAIISSSGSTFWMLPVLMGILFLGIFGTSIGFSLYWRRKLETLIGNLAAHCEATNRANSSHGMQWSIRSQRYYRSTAVWLQCDLPMSVIPTPAAQGSPVQGYPAGYPYPATAVSGAVPTAVPLPAYGATPPTASSGTPSPGQLPPLADRPPPPPLRWPGGTDVAGTSAQPNPKNGDSSLDWPV